MRLALNYQRVDPSKGGAETYVVDLCRRLVRAGHSVDLYAETWREGVLPPEVNCVRVAATGPTKLARTWAFGENSEAALRAASYDCTVGFINTWYHDVLIPQGGVHGGSLECNARRFPAGWERSLYLLGKVANPKFWAYRAIERKQYGGGRPLRVVAVSRMVMGHLQRFHRVPANRVHVIPNAIDAGRLDVPDPADARSRFREAAGLAPGDLAGLFVGHNFGLKGLKPLLFALALRKQQAGARPVKLAVCGGGKVGPFRRLAKGLGLAGDVKFLGFYPEVRDAYHGCDFFASPTYYDPCSLVVFEALACGLPVMTTACNGAGELMTNGREGFVVRSPDSVAEIASAVDRMAVDGERLAMSANASALGREQSMDRHVGRLVRVFEEVAAMKSSRRPHAPRAGMPASKVLR